MLSTLAIHGIISLVFGDFWFSFTLFCLSNLLTHSLYKLPGSVAHYRTYSSFLFAGLTIPSREPSTAKTHQPNPWIRLAKPFSCGLIRFFATCALITCAMAKSLSWHQKRFLNMFKRFTKIFKLICCYSKTVWHIDSNRSMVNMLMGLVTRLLILTISPWLACFSHFKVQF